MTTEPRTEGLREAVLPYFTVHMTSRAHEDGDGCYQRAEDAVLRPPVAAEAGALDVERLADALAFAHPGPRPWPGKLTSAEFARTIAAEYSRLAAPIPVADPSEAPR